jgi:hypothetical protein
LKAERVGSKYPLASKAVLRKKIEGIAVEMTTSGLADNSDNSTVVIAVLGIKIISKNTELFNGIQVGQNRGAPVHAFLNVDTVNHEAMADSRWPLMERLLGFASPEGSMLPVTPAMVTELGSKVETGVTPG